MTSDQLDVRGINTIADAVTLLPANNAGTMNASWSSFGFAKGASAVSLRGLTTSASLTTFDGLRMAPYPLGDDGRRNFVDLSTIPDAIVDRVEVLKDGASSTYGADAIAGVVNVITKKEITGLHFNGTGGVSQEGDGNEYRGDLTWGTGELASDGWNFYANVEYQRSDAITYQDRNGFFGRDWTRICNKNGGCLDNRNANGLEADGHLDGVGYTEQPTIRAWDSTTGTYVPGATWQLLNPSVGCSAVPWLREVNPNNSAAINLTGPVCESGAFGPQVHVYPDIQRNGVNLRYTTEINDRTEFYVMGNYYRTTTSHPGGTPYIFGGTTSPAGIDVPVVGITPVILPVYVCPLGAGGPVTCDASNGVLNPNNPLAASGQEARVLYQVPFPRETSSVAESYRYAAGITGSFGADDGWDYSVEAVKGTVVVDQTQTGYPIARRVLNVVYDGSFNFVDPRLNSKQLWDYIAPPSRTHSTSSVDQIQATLSRSLFEAPGGDVIGAVGVAWRREEVDQPNANPPKQDPYERYLSLNAVSTAGSRKVNSAFFEIDAPLVDMLTVNVSGRYDDYSTGQSNFSPKIGLQFQPIDMIKLRGTYSEGFRIPSFNEAFGAPTTGYVTTQINPNTPEGAAFLAAHGNNAYASNAYSYGLTGVGNPEVNPEESKAYTAGIVFQPTDGLSVTLDYWHIEIKNLITGADYSQVLDQYYQNNGVVNVPGITVVPGAIDPDYPNALPLIGFIVYPYSNADSEIASGIDLGVNWTHDFGSFVFSTNLDMSKLDELSKTISGVKQEYQGTLSPCDVTSCSGAPDLRATWVNRIEMDKLSFALTANYTSSYDNASVDYGATKGDCEASAYNSVYMYDDGTPLHCTHGSYLDFDFSASYMVRDGVQVFANVMNAFDKKPEFDPAAAYWLYGFNPAWELNGWRGRYFRLGVKVDFE